MLLAFGAEFALLGIECHTISIGVSPYAYLGGIEEVF